MLLKDLTSLTSSLITLRFGVLTCAVPGVRVFGPARVGIGVRDTGQYRIGVLRLWGPSRSASYARCVMAVIEEGIVITGLALGVADIFSS